MLNRKHIEKTIYTNLIVLILLFIFGFLAYTILLILAGSNPYFPLIISLAALTFAIYYTLICLKIVTQAKRIGINLFEDKRIGINFGFLFGSLFEFYIIFILFLLVYLKVRPSIVISAAYLLVFGLVMFFLLFGIIKGRKRIRITKVRIKLNKGKILITVIDTIIGVVMFYMSTLIENFNIILKFL